MAVTWPRGLPGQLCYGGDYNPEQWTEETWAEDVALMQQARVNLVSLGVFAWSRLEPKEGEYDFGWLDRVLDLLQEAGVRAALATPTASPPPWFSFAHPEALPVTAQGVRLSHGSRDTYCPSSPAYRAAALRITAAIGERYADHPALAMWHVHNEYGTSCHCDQSAARFRDWLRAKYGSLDRLNEAWTTSFWSQTYSDWDHILTPRATQYLPNPTQLLDFRRFTSDELLACFREQRDQLHALAPDVPVTTNFVLGSWVPVDHRAWAEEVDVVSIDHYPASADALQAEAETAFVADLARGWAGGRPWLLIEQAPNLIYTGGRMLAKEPGRMSRLSLSHVARGSRGVMFFQWRAPRGGAELFHSAMVPHAGACTRVFGEVRDLGAKLQRIAEADAGRVDASVAVLWDDQAGWALQGPGLPSPDVDYLANVRSVHAALWRAGITADVVAPDEDLSRYQLVLVPSLYLTSDESAKSIRSFVESGGSLVVWYLSGMVDQDNRIRLGGYPGAFRDLLGVRVEELHPTPEVTLSNGDTGRLWSELVRLDGAETVAAYASGVLAGQAAITCHRYGAGLAWYVSTQLDNDALDRFVASAVTAAGIAPASGGAVTGVEVVRRRTEESSWLFAINHTEEPYEIAATGRDLLTDRTIGGRLRLEPGAMAVLHEA
jgi:beta-galactosidase